MVKHDRILLIETTLDHLRPMRKTAKVNERFLLLADELYRLRIFYQRWE
jgi:hypothetical protein